MTGVTATSTGGALAAALLKLRTGDYRDRVATRSAKRMQRLASEYAPVLTGALSQSPAVQSHLENDYADRVATVQALNPKAAVFPEPAAPTEVGHAVVLCVVTYGIFVDAGTIHQSAQPWWSRARVETEAALQADAEAEWSA